MKKIKLNSYNIYIGKGILDIDSSKKLINDNRKKIIVTDENIWNLKIQDKLKLNNVVKTIVIKSGEKSKSLENATKILNEMLEANFTRDSVLVALGGGVVGDLVGFVSSIYFRGIDIIQIPTTLLSMVDSSIGGKTGINFGGYKNSIGTFHNPIIVLIDTNLLNTLEEREIKSGLGEIIKYGLIRDESIINELEKEGIKNIEELIYKSLCIKKNIVAGDEKEKGIRKILNFGHTIGHSIESLYNFEKYSHGEAVALGMIKMIKDKQYKNRVVNLLKKLNMNYEINLKLDEIIKLIGHDKKSLNENEIEIIISKKIGTCEIKKVTFNNLYNVLKEGEKNE